MNTYRSGEAGAIIKGIIMSGLTSKRSIPEILSDIVEFRESNLGVDQHSIEESVVNFLTYCHDMPVYISILSEIYNNFPALLSTRIRCQYALMVANHGKDFTKSKQLLSEVEELDPEYVSSKQYKAFKLNILLLDGYLINQEEIERLMQEMRSQLG